MLKELGRYLDILFGSKERPYDQKFSTLETAIHKEISDLRNDTLAGQRDLQEQLRQQSKSMLEEIHDKHEALGADLERAVRGLRSEKTDRVELACMPMEVALRLKKESELPSAD